MMRAIAPNASAAAARLTERVVLPEPPFWLTMAMMVMAISFPCARVDV